VIQYLASLYPHENLSFELISRKLATLLALTTAQKLQILAIIQLSQILISVTLVIRISTRLKTSGIRRSQLLLIFRQFRENSELCVFSLFKYYVNFTRDLRQVDCDTLFISPRLPHKPVSSQTLGHLDQNCISLNKDSYFNSSTHSTRQLTPLVASTSLAANKGISLNGICRNGSEISTIFARFYNRPVI